MKRGATWYFSLIACAVQAFAQSPVPAANFPPAVAYTLLDGSAFVDDCLVCDRPTILQPLRGTFDLVLLQDTPPLTRYAVRNINFTAAPGPAGEVHVTGSGIYTRFEEFARLQNVELAVQVRNAFTNQFAYFTNETPIAGPPFPMIQVSLRQTNGTILQTFSMELIAAPLREIWFSTARSLTSTNHPGPAVQISAGDLLSNRGRVVKRNIDLVGRLGVMPIVPDLGLDAVDVTRRGEILFSIPEYVWSETLGALQEGDLLSNCGRIVKRNQALLAAFGVMPGSPDAGLDAVELMPDGEILFSIRTNRLPNSTGIAGVVLAHGDILSDRGYLFRSNRELLKNFHPAVTNLDFGLDAFSVLPGGEIWFSIQTDFLDNLLGPVQAGDVLSDRGYRVMRNRDLVAAFGPLDPSLDYGLDAMCVITDTRPPLPRPWIIGIQRDGAQNGVRLDWDGEGSVFAVERAPCPAGPWEPCSPLLPDLSFEDNCADTNGAQASQLFYRVRQW